MHYFVTGHRGYVGTVLCPRLKALGHRVTGLDTDLFRACSFGGEPPFVPGLRKDLRDVVPTDLAGVDVVIHLAALSNDPLGDMNPRLTHDINFVATERLARAAKAAGVKRFVFSSSCSAYGVGSHDLLSEDSPLCPVTPYAVSKIRSEEMLDFLADDSFSPVFLRSGTAYGPSPRIRFDLLVNNLVAWARATGEVRLKSDGTAWRPLVHVADMSEAFICAATAERKHVHRETFNVGRTEDSMQVRDVAAMVQKRLKGTKLSFADGASPDKRTYRVDCSKIARIGFQCRRDVAGGIDELEAAFVRFNVSVGDFEGPRYQRLAHIRLLNSSGQLGDDLRWLSKASA